MTTPSEQLEDNTKEIPEEEEDEGVVP